MRYITNYTHLRNSEQLEMVQGIPEEYQKENIIPETPDEYLGNIIILEELREAMRNGTLEESQRRIEVCLRNT